MRKGGSFFLFFFFEFFYQICYFQCGYCVFKVFVVFNFCFVEVLEFVFDCYYVEDNWNVVVEGDFCDIFCDFVGNQVKVFCFIFDDCFEGKNCVVFFVFGEFFGDQRYFKVFGYFYDVNFFNVVFFEVVEGIVEEFVG